MPRSKDAFSEIAQVAAACDFTATTRRDEGRTYFHANANHAPLSLSACWDDDRPTGEVWVTVRTNSFSWSGERTDLHDVIAHAVAIVLRLDGHSCSLWEIENPAIYIPSEVYAYVLRFDQGPVANLRATPADIQQLGDLLIALTIAWRVFWLAFWNTQQKPDDLSDYARADSWGARISRFVREGTAPEDISHTWRHHPTWMHFRNIQSGTIIINCAPLTRALRSLYAEGCRQRHQLVTEAATLIREQGMRNAIPVAELSAARDLICSIERLTRPPQLLHDVLEDRIVLFGRRHILIQRSDSGKRAYEEEQARIVRRHKQEMEFLVPLCCWAESVDPGRFEHLVLELLHVEPGVVRIRQVGPTNQADGGRDHLAEWHTPPPATTKIPDHHPPSISRRVVIQCKAYKGAVGKNDIGSIRDILEEYDCSGFFLAVSSQLSTGLVDRLDKLRRTDNGLFVEWWERPQLEQRLREHPEVLAQFPDVVTMSPSSGGGSRDI
jgi:hypothetical protein